MSDLKREVKGKKTDLDVGPAVLEKVDAGLDADLSAVSVPAS